MSSIRGYLLTRLLGGTALLLLVAGGFLFLVVKRQLAGQLDRNLDDRIQGLASILFQVEDEVEFEFSEQLMPEYGVGPAPEYFELRYAGGAVLERSGSLGEGELEVRGSAGPETAFWTAPLPDGRDGRYAARLVEVHHVYPEEGPDRPTAARLLVVVARGREELVAAERRVLVFGGLFVLVLLGLSALLARLAVERGLRPARRLAAELDALRMERLPAGLDAGELPEELQAMGRTADALVRRVDAALRRERRTAADIAHELRTPISELVTVSEVHLRNGSDPGGARKALGVVHDVAWQMGRAVATLLKLARLEMGDERFEQVEVPLGRVVAEVLGGLGRFERERRLGVESRVPGEARVRGDEEVLRIVVTNLLANALGHAVRGTRVSCALEETDDGWWLEVANETDELGPEDLAHLGEPFWRKDASRSDRGRTGLGLALSSALAAAAGLELRFELRGTTLRARLGERSALPGPLSPDRSPGAERETPRGR